MSVTFKKAPPGRGDRWAPGLVGPSFADFGLCGASSERGLLRFHDGVSGPVGQRFATAVFGPRGLVAEVLAYDWLARQFAVTSDLTPEGDVSASGSERTVVVLDPFDMSVTPWCGADDFMRALQTDAAEDFLLDGLFELWRRRGGFGALALDRCAGATVPGFYGGELELGNLEDNDVEVYLEFTTELWRQRQATGATPPVLRME